VTSGAVIDGVHAADEVMFVWTAGPGGRLFARGKGAMLGTGEEDAWSEEYVAVALPRPAAASAAVAAADDAAVFEQRVESVTGVNFVVIKAAWRLAASDGAAISGGGVAWYALGDNYFGQLAQGDEDTRCAPVEVLPPAALGPRARILDIQPGYRHLVALVEEEEATSQQQSDAVAATEQQQ
jgi:alpha-tubulin suppressor-like RCC1 family protein